MAASDHIAAAGAALDSCRTALDKLDRLCCEPGRSPRMKALGETLAEARTQLEGTHISYSLPLLEDAGAQIGRLQVGCCAPGRMPLYAEFLEGLTTAQISINQQLGLGHQ